FLFIVWLARILHKLLLLRVVLLFPFRILRFWFLSFHLKMTVLFLAGSFPPRDVFVLLLLFEEYSDKLVIHLYSILFHLSEDWIFFYSFK
ncbi:unnamed protein product, partial [Larinioides sclopetarius]